MQLKQESNIAAWNICSLIDQDDTDRPHRHAVLITSELARYKIDIATLSETRLAGEGELTEKSSGYSFFWSGHAPDDGHKAGVGYAIKASLVGKLACPSKGVNHCLLTKRLPLHHRKKFATIISAYATTMTNTDKTKDNFFEDFEYVISAVLTAEKFIILGDLNASVGQDSTSWEGRLAHLHDLLCTTKKYVLRSIRSTIQLKLSEMQDFWLISKVTQTKMT